MTITCREKKIFQQWIIIAAMSLRTLTIVGQTPAEMQPVQLQCAFKTNPTGIDATPLLSWQIPANGQQSIQTAWQVLVADNKQALEKNIATLWDSKKVAGSKTLQIRYKGKALQAATTYYWKVRVWDTKGKSSAWSKPAQWQTGLLTRAGWKGAHWIAFETLEDSQRVVPGIHNAAGMKPNQLKRRPTTPLFRKSFNAPKAVASATLFITGLGHYDAFLNGRKIGNSFLAPGWTHYDSTILYNSYDLTQQIRQGENVLGVVVGNGFYHINRERYAKLVVAYGLPKMICRLAVKYTDGTEDNILSDQSWKTAPSPITYTSIYGGEDYDAQLEQPGWSAPGFDAGYWKPAILPIPPSGNLQAEADYPMTVQQNFSQVAVKKLTDSAYLYDFGQNCSGIIELKIKGLKGQQIKLVPAELIGQNGQVNQDAIGKPYYYSYTCKGESEEIWRPSFSYYGMRYVQTEAALPDTALSKTDLPRITSLKVLHVRNSTPVTGSFSCSNPLFNQIFTLINWAIQSNLVSVLSDCPHREKLGWLEQTYLMGNAIQYNFHIANLYQKIVQDMMEAQTPNGLVPDIAPEFVAFDDGFRDSPEWGSAAIMLPWLLHKWYADTETMRRAWPMMERYMKYLQSKSKGEILSHGLGDWYDLGPNHPGPAQLTPKALTASAIYCYDLQLMAQMAALMDKTETARYYQQWANTARDSFIQKFFNPATAIFATGSQTAMAMPWCLNLVPDAYRSKVLTNLADSIKANGYALTAGDIGFHYLVQALTEGGYADLLYRMNNRNDVPGYGFQLKKGATALTESWQALENVSNNHLMLGHLMEWFYAGIGGITQVPGSAGWSRIVIEPQITGDLSWANTIFQSPHGTISTQWQKEGGWVTLHLTIPGNTMAEFRAHAVSSAIVNGKAIQANGLWRIGPGNHIIRWPLAAQ